MFKAILFLVLLIGAPGMNGCKALTHNRAETRPDHPDLSLRTRTYPFAYEHFFGAVSKVIEDLPRWELVQSDLSTGIIHATRQTRILRFIDDIQIQVTKQNEQEVAVDLNSSSRVGTGDLGQNARNIREFMRQLEVF